LYDDALYKSTFYLLAVESDDKTVFEIVYY